MRPIKSSFSAEPEVVFDLKSADADFLTLQFSEVSADYSVAVQIDAVS